MVVVTVIRQIPFNTNFVSHVFPKRKYKSWYGIAFASKNDIPQDSEPQRRFPLSFKLPNPILAQSAVAIFALGFIDAGYSGDWSRIGVISKESEELLKIVLLQADLRWMQSFLKDAKNEQKNNELVGNFVAETLEIDYDAEDIK